MKGWHVGVAATIAGGLALVAAGMAAERYLEARDAGERAMAVLLGCLEPWHEAGPDSLPGYSAVRKIHIERCAPDIPVVCRRAAEFGRPVEACDWVLVGRR